MVEQKIKKAVFLMFIPALLNLSLTCHFFTSQGKSEFLGYLTGTLLSILFSIIWILQTGKGVNSSFIKLLKITFFGFTGKIAVFCFMVFGGYLFWNFNRFYFTGAFLLGTIIALVIEVWFLFTMFKIGKKENSKARQN